MTGHPSGKVIAIVQARMSSRRLPGKVLMPVLGRPMLARQIERVQRAGKLDGLVVATSDRPDDDAIADLCAVLDLDCFRGSLDDVLDRTYRAACAFDAGHVVRLTGDCPVADPALIDAAIGLHLDGEYDYTGNCTRRTYPDGLDVEVIRFRCLEEAWREAASPFEREHVTPFIHRRPERYRHGEIVAAQDLSHLRLTVDTEEDLARVRTIYETLYPENAAFTTADILSLLDRAPAPDGTSRLTSRQR